MKKSIRKTVAISKARKPLPSKKAQGFKRTPKSLSNKKKTHSLKSSLPFRIIGIGGSAGGLEAYEKFFSSTPADSGLAYVLVTHLDPNHKSMLTELLRKCTDMEIADIENGMRVKPNHVYVLPPNKELSILKGVLYLLELSQPQGMRQPINLFFESLAADQDHHAVGVILSGMGSDGTRGLKTIKERGGLVVVQEPKSAKYDSMPLSAIKTGLADLILPPEKIAEKVIGYINRASIINKDTTQQSSISDSDLDPIIIVLRQQTGQDFSMYKKNTIRRRVERRMNLHQIEHLSRYVLYLQQNTQEVESLFKELLIGVTHFFRDEKAFEVLKKRVIVPLLKNKGVGNGIRVWSIGCSTGEEAFSLAILLKEESDKYHTSGLKIQVFATDIDSKAIETARRGVYPSTIEENVSAARLRKYFVKHDEGYQIKKEIRNLAVFAVHNVIKEPPFTKIDLICCRNLLIYFLPELQKQMLPFFHYSLNPGGILFLGTSESIGNSGALFSTIDARWKLFKRREAASSVNKKMELLYPRGPDSKNRREMPVSVIPETRKVLPVDIQKILFEEYSSPSVIINRRGDILYINGKTGKYLELNPGGATLNIFSMIREPLAIELEKAVNQSLKKKNKVIVKNIRITFENHYETIDLIVKPIPEKGIMEDLLMVVFLETGHAKYGAKRKATIFNKTNKEYNLLEEELQRTKEHLQHTVEIMETSVEEYNSSNEELQSTNEELQSMNEEAMTAKEELQSLNEELLSVNTELQAKIEALNKAGNDMKNLLDSTEIATIFLDLNMNIRGFTPQAMEMANLISTDIGRPFRHIRANFESDGIDDLIRDVMDNLSKKDLQVQTKDDKWYSIRIIPYRTYENVIDGTVITLFNITAFKNLEDELRSTANFAENVINTIREPLVILNHDFTVVSVNKAFYDTFRVMPTQTIGQLIFDLGNRQWDIPDLRSLLKKTLTDNAFLTDFQIIHNFPVIGKRKIMLNARKVKNSPKEPGLILLAMEDITDLPEGTKQNT